MNEETISIKQAAKLLGISEQAVYKRLNTTFKPYVEQRLNNHGKPQKCLNKRVIDDFCAQKKQETAQSNSTVEQPFNSTVEQPLNNPKTAPESALVASLEERLSDRAEEIKRLVAQLDAKDKQIQAKDEQISALHEELHAEQVLHLKALARLEAYQHPDPEEQHSQEEPPKEETKGFKAWWKHFWTTPTP